jgi:hypothetical protein
MGRVIQISLDTPERQKYDALFEESPDAFIQQSTLWAEVIAALGPDVPLFLLWEKAGEVAAGLPLYFFKSELGSIATSVPQAGPMGGVFCRPGLSAKDREEAYADLLRVAVELARTRNCIALSLITNPLESDIDLYRRHLAPDLTLENFTQCGPVSRAVRDGTFVLPDNDQRNPGRTIRKSRAAGLSGLVSDDPAMFERWLTIHRVRHRSLGLTPLPDALLRGIFSVLVPQRRAFLQLAVRGDDIASGCLFIHHKRVCDAFMMSMDPAFSTYAPNYILTQEGLLTMARRELVWFNWQSSAQRENGVYKFKKQWGSDEYLYFYVTRLFVPVEQIIARGRSAVAGAFSGHYVVPFGIFENPAQREFRK